MTQILITEGDEAATEILVEQGLLERTGLRELVTGPAEPPAKVAIFAQPGSVALAARIAERLGGEFRVLPDREESKRLAVVESCYLWLNDLAFTRSDLVIGVGGGALTDVVGFVAGTYLRGVPVVFVPTTLLGAVDAAIGGKSAVNVGGKNLAGVFRHPSRVLIDTQVLAALPEELLREGAAEAVKAGWIGDPELVDLYEAHGLAAPVDEVVRRAVSVKATIVSEDFREGSKRAWLNYGHTVGHAVEVAAGISHGAAVSIGMVAAAVVAGRQLGFSEAARQRSILETLGLPVSAPNVDVDEVRQLMALDKKRDVTGLRMTLLRKIADPVVTYVEDHDITAALGAVGIS